MVARIRTRSLHFRRQALYPYATTPPRPQLNLTSKASFPQLREHITAGKVLLWNRPLDPTSAGIHNSDQNQIVWIFCGRLEQFSNETHLTVRLGFQSIADGNYRKVITVNELMQIGLIRLLSSFHNLSRFFWFDDTTSLKHSKHENVFKCQRAQWFAPILTSWASWFKSRGQEKYSILKCQHKRMLGPSSVVTAHTVLQV